MNQNETINEALARAEAAEKDRDAAVEARVSARTEADKALGCIAALARYLGRPREKGETIDAWWKRLSATLHEHLPSLYADPKPCSNPHCVPYEAHAKLMGEKKQLRRERDDAIQRLRIAEEAVVEYRAKLDTLAAFVRGGVAAIVRA